jgi:hypothetical protein
VANPWERGLAEVMNMTMKVVERLKPEWLGELVHPSVDSGQHLNPKLQYNNFLLKYALEYSCRVEYLDFAYKFRKMVTFISIDDKSKIDIGEPR